MLRFSQGCRKRVGRVGAHPPRFWQNRRRRQAVAGGPHNYLPTQIFRLCYTPVSERATKFDNITNRIIKTKVWTIWKFSRGLLKALKNNLLWPRKTDGQVFRSAEVQKTAKEFLHGLHRALWRPCKNISSIFVGFSEYMSLSFTHTFVL